MNTIQDQLTATEAAIKSGNFPEAEAISRQLLAQDLPPEEKATALLYLSESLWRRGLAQEALPFAQEALSIAEELEQKELQAKALSNIGIIYKLLSDYTKALNYHLQALAVCYDCENNIGIASNLGNIGNIYRNLSEYQHALEYYHQALALNKELGRKNSIAINMANIGNVYLELSDYVQALEYYHQALALHEDCGNKNDVARLRLSIGLLYYFSADYVRALEYNYQALALNEELGNKSGVAYSLNNLANIYRELSDFPRALEYFCQALTISERINDESGIAINLANIGIVYFQLSDYHRALEYSHQAIELNNKLGRKSNLANNLSNIGNIHLRLLDYFRAIEYYNQSLLLNEELNRKDQIAINLTNIGNIYAENNFVNYDINKAEEYLLRALAISQELGTKKHLYEVYKSLAKLYKQQARWQEHAEYLQQYYDIRDEVQTEEAKKLADKYAFQRQIAVMEKEREVTDMLLHKFLPSPIVNEVKAKEGKILVQQFNNISVLFADLVGFTKLSLAIKPEVMIEMLNYIFTKFDTIIKEAGGHRIRTMGDGYFAICGAPDLVENHQYKLAKAALKFMEDIFLPEHIKKYLPEGTVLDIRIGLHCGEAVCGMVGGLEKWQYDAYGDTINTASRMESHGEAGKIHISEDFKNSLMDYDEFIFLPREPIFIKGKGLMNTYFLQ